MSDSTTRSGLTSSGLVDDLESVRQALEPCCPGCSYNKHGDSNLPAIVDAAGRLVRLAETGPDYEAAKIQLHEILREAGVDVFVNSDLVVDAAVPWLSDYTKEE